MAFYGLATIPLQNILRINIPSVKQVWLADDATGAGKLQPLREWWDSIVSNGINIGYYINESKSWLILKDPTKLMETKRLFADTNIKITSEGKRHLGAAIGNNNFRKEYATEKVSKWCKEIEQLSIYAKSQPHAAFSAFIHGIQHKYTYFLRTIQGMEEFILPLDKVLTETFLPTLLDSAINATERELFSLPIRKGGLNVPIFSEKASTDYETSKKLTAPLAAIIVLQGLDLPGENEQNVLRTRLSKEREINLTRKVESVEKELSNNTLRAVKQSQATGASNWLNVIPLEDQGFTLTKNEFRDALALRYNRPFKGLPSKCPCGNNFDINHALNCKRGGFVIMRHNNIRDFEANLLHKVYNDVETEPSLQPLNGEHINGLTGDESRHDIRARGVWRSGQNAYFDIRITNPNSNSQVHQPIENILKRHETEKKRQYNSRVMNIEHGTFTPLIFALNGGVGKECSMFHKHIAERIATKSGDRYESVLTWMRCKLSFLVLRGALLCIRGSRSHKNVQQTNVVDDFQLACDDAHLF